MNIGIFVRPGQPPRKNGRRICPINDDLSSAYTLATPQNSLCAKPARLAAGRRSHRHDA